MKLYLSGTQNAASRIVEFGALVTRFLGIVDDLIFDPKFAGPFDKIGHCTFDRFFTSVSFCFDVRSSAAVHLL